MVVERGEVAEGKQQQAQARRCRRVPALSQVALTRAPTAAAASIHEPALSSSLSAVKTEDTDEPARAGVSHCCACCWAAPSPCMLDDEIA